MIAKTLIIAEAGVNHNGSLDTAKRLVEAAAEAGADIVKFQTFKADKLVSKSAPRAEYQEKNTGDKDTQYEMLKKLELSREDHVALIEHCKKMGIEFLSTPFDFESLDLLAGDLNLPRLKLGSGELTNAPLLLAAAKTGKNLILSTGMGDIADIDNALGVLAFGYSGSNERPHKIAFSQALHDKTASKKLQEKVSILHCTTEYPSPFEDVNLRAIGALHERYGLTVGFSDHTVGIDVAVASVAMGAKIIEKHFTLDRKMPGPDHVASLEPAELKAMVTGIRRVEAALGDGLKIARPSEKKNMPVARKSLVAAADIRSGESFTEDNVTIKRPGSGRSPFDYWDVIGTSATKDYKKDDLL